MYRTNKISKKQKKLGNIFCFDEDRMNDKINQRLKKWEIRLYTAQTGHYIASEKYQNIHTIIGLPLVILSTFVSAFLFFNSDVFWHALFLKISGLVVAIFASIQTFLRPAEKAEMHRSKATKYGKLKRSIELFRNSQFDEDQFQKFCQNFTFEWNAIAEDAPVTAQSIRNKVNLLLTEEFKNISKFEKKHSASNKKTNIKCEELNLGEKFEDKF